MSDPSERRRSDGRAGRPPVSRPPRRTGREDVRSFRPEEPDDDSEYRIEGRNALNEALRAGRTVEKVFVAEGLEKSALTPLIAKCRAAGAVVVSCDRRRLDAMSDTGAHQGVVAFVSPCEYVSVGDIVDAAEASGRPALIVVCDHIEDPRNLGAILRSAEVAGAHGVVIPRRRGASVTGTVVKASAGAALHLPIARTANVNAAIRELKERGVWVLGAEGGQGDLVYDADLRLPTAFVLGSEGGGLARLTAESCDRLVRIPMLGRVNSLNVSAAAAVLLFEAVRQRTATERS
ncbi:MAG: 23S rRNA (guanosine(2251)-2'-O)-methyltransferase RlmB [Oscillospiraceae bacterium]|jgi:23S rRNA (guanosine2251-2'-O)-methyltransferase|nr:23S rRNA (guanosine(2251)-2'-O)-methyltransferase RlmB [Oscillospiraceae bacterium]